MGDCLERPWVVLCAEDFDDGWHDLGLDLGLAPRRHQLVLEGLAVRVAALVVGV